MLIPALFGVTDTFLIQGLLDGSLERYGGVIRWAAGTGKGGQIYSHLVEGFGLTSQLMLSPVSTALQGINLVVDVAGHGVTIHKVNQVQKTLSAVMGLTQIAAGASVLNLGVSIAGFAYMGYKLNQVQNAIGDLKKSMDAGFQNIEERLDTLSRQLGYLHLLVEDSREEQKRLSGAINELHKAFLIKEIADLQAELISLRYFPDSLPKDAVKTAARVRLFLGSQALQAPVELDAQNLLLTDVATQGWAVATATEAHLLLEHGLIREAQELLAYEVPRFEAHSRQWTSQLLKSDRTELATAYRFQAPRFTDHITPERIERIVRISPVDCALNAEQTRRRQKEVEVEYEMFRSATLDEQWNHRQIAVAEYLDTFSELTARLDSVKAFADLCEQQGVKSSRQLLPGEDAKPELYILGT